MSQSEKSITLTPSWKAFFRGYVLGVLLIPVLIGIVVLWRTVKEHRSLSYIITDRDITVEDGSISQKIDLANISQTEIRDKKFGVGTILLKTQARQVEMRGLENPEQLKESIDKAIALELRRLEEQKKAKPRKMEFEPGTMDRLDYLTGLWQQGLISDEEYHSEKKHFE